MNTPSHNICYQIVKRSILLWSSSAFPCTHARMQVAVSPDVVAVVAAVVDKAADGML